MSLSSEELENLSDLLLSVNDTNTEIAFEILSGQEIFPKGLLTEVFVVYKLTDSKVIKEKAMTFLEHYGIDKTSNIIKAKAHLKTANRRNGATEKTIKSNIATYVRTSNGKLDGVKMATAMFNKYGVGLHYLLNNASKEQQCKLLETFIKGSVFKMNGVSLTKVPDALYEFENLTEIDLSENDLTTFPSKLKVFKKLKRLNIRDNKVKKISKSIITLKELTHLNISENRIPEFPVEISKMHQLTHLYLDKLEKYQPSSHYFTIPQDFQNLPNIHELELSSYNDYPNNLRINYTNYPSFTTISSDKPLDLNPLNLAEYAYLSNGKYDGVSYLFQHSIDTALKHKIIDEQFYDSTQKLLDFKQIQLHNFPNELSDFDVEKINCNDLNIGFEKNLNREKTLYKQEELDELCKDLNTLQNVEEATFQNNSLMFIPSSLLTWGNLKKLDLSRNELGGASRFSEIINVNNLLVDKDLSNWSKLEELDLSSNNIFELPESFKSLKKLKKLDLDSNSIQELSPTILHLISLEELSLDSNSVESLPTELPKLNHLKRLQIEISKIEVFDVLSTLFSLEILELTISIENQSTQNHCEDIVKKIIQLPNLKTLRFFDNQMYSHCDNYKETIEFYQNAFNQYLPNSCELRMERY